MVSLRGNLWIISTASFTGPSKEASPLSMISPDESKGFPCSSVRNKPRWLLLSKGSPNADQLSPDSLVAINDLGPGGETWTLASLTYASKRLYTYDEGDPVHRVASPTLSSSVFFVVVIPQPVKIRVVAIVHALESWISIQPFGIGFTLTSRKKNNEDSCHTAALVAYIAVDSLLLMACPIWSGRG